MEVPTLFSILQRKETTKARNEREELLSLFLENLNGARIKEGFKPMTPRSLAVIISHVPTVDLYPFYKKCQQATVFGKCFWGSLKTK